MNRPVVLVGPKVDTDTETLLRTPQVARALARVGEVRLSRAASGTPEFRRELAEVDVLLLIRSIAADELASATRLRLISVTATGHQFYIESAAARRLGIRVAYVPSYGADAIAEHTLTLALCAAKDVVGAHLAVRAGAWPQRPTVQLAGDVAGVVGLGSIGRRVINLLEGIGMEVLVWSRNPRPERLHGTTAVYADLEDLFERSQLVTLHLAATPDTAGIVDESLLGRMRPGAILVNTARANLVKPEALERHVATGRVRAAVDVLSQEPPTAAQLASLPSALVVTPHVAFNTREAAAALVVAAIDNIVAYEAGETLRAEVLT